MSPLQPPSQQRSLSPARSLLVRSAASLEKRFARRRLESCDDAAAAARRFEVRSVAVHQHVRDEVTGEAQPLVNVR